MKTKLTITLSIALLLSLQIASRAYNVKLGAQAKSPAQSFLVPHTAGESLADNTASIEPSPADKFGAIAYSESTGKFGWAINRQSRLDAESVALYKCGERGARDCQVKVWFKNTCAALVGSSRQDRNGKYRAAWSWASSQAEAEENALSRCKNNGDATCRILVSVCAAPSAG